MTYLHRFTGAVQDHWIRILLGAATGVYVAFAACLATMLLWVAHDVRISDLTLALFMDGVLLVCLWGGALVGYVTRKRVAA